MNSTPTTKTARTADAVIQLEYDFADIAVSELGMHEQEAFGLAKAMVTGLRKRYGGQRLGRDIYVPSHGQEERAVRDAAVRLEFNGRNHAEVLRKHRISRSQLYRIIKKSHD